MSEDPQQEAGRRMEVGSIKTTEHPGSEEWAMARGRIKVQNEQVLRDQQERAASWKDQEDNTTGHAAAWMEVGIAHDT